jgi:hypothetical protein
MKRTAFILIWIATTEIVPCIASHSSEPLEPEILVYVSETCSLSPAAKEAAQKMASNLFDRIGIRLRFTGARPERVDPGIVTLHLLDRTPKNVAPVIVGAANIDPGHSDAYVFCDRVAGFYYTVHDREVGVLLGYAIAHELGHVLLGTPAHSPDGVMRACWRRTDVGLMLQHAVGFSRADAERIHAIQASRRTAALLSAGMNRRAP